MAQFQERRVGTSSVGGRADQGIHHVKAAVDKNGAGVPNQGGMLALDVVDAAGVVSTVYLFCSISGATAALRITGTVPAGSAPPANTNTGGVLV